MSREWGAGGSPSHWRGSVDSTSVLQIGYKGEEVEKVKEGETQTWVAGGKVDQSLQRGEDKLRGEGEGTW